MSLTTWTPAALTSELHAFNGRCWRLVEAQNRVSTMKLVDTLDEQTLLEDLIEATKPDIPAECQHLHYLLATPFRYGSVYPTGSRFRRAGRTPGVYYAAEAPETAVAEMAFHRLLFFAESPATPWPVNAAVYTAFSTTVTTGHLLDLTAPPLARDRPRWTDPVDYDACQTLAKAGREAGCQAIRYESVRDPQRRANLALLTCRAFKGRAPASWQTWHLHLSPHGARVFCEAPATRIEFDRAAFAADPRIAALNWERG